MSAFYRSPPGEKEVPIDTICVQDQAHPGGSITEHLEADKTFKAVMAEADAMAGLAKRIPGPLGATAFRCRAGRRRRAQGSRRHDAASSGGPPDPARGPGQGAEGSRAPQALVEKTAEHDRDKADLLEFEAHAKHFDASAGQRRRHPKPPTKPLATRSAPSNPRLSTSSEPARTHSSSGSLMMGARPRGAVRGCAHSWSEASQAFRPSFMGAPSPSSPLTENHSSASRGSRKRACPAHRTRSRLQ